MAVLQGRSFGGVIYPDSTSYNCGEVIDRIQSYFDSYAMCSHDMDIHEEDGSLKKVHIHWCGQLAGPRLLSTVANKLGLQEHDIELLKSWKASVRYLIHAGAKDQDKAQYKIEDIVTNLDLSKYFREDAELLQVNKIRAYIVEAAEQGRGLLWYELFDWCTDHGCVHELKRYTNAYSKYLEDINLLYRSREDRRTALFYRMDKLIH